MVYEGGCHCGASRYKASGTPQHVSVCHCDDCRKCAGAPFVSWAAFSSADFEFRGDIKTYMSSTHAVRHFLRAVRDWSLLCERRGVAGVGRHPDLHIGQSRSSDAALTRAGGRTTEMDFRTGKPAEVRSIPGIVRLSRYRLSGAAALRADY